MTTVLKLKIFFFFLTYIILNIFGFNALANSKLDVSTLSKKGYVSIYPKQNQLNLLLINKSLNSSVIFIRIGTQNLYQYHSIDIFRLNSGFNYTSVLKINGKPNLLNGPLIPINDRSKNPDLQTFKIKLLPNQTLNLSVLIENFGLKKADNSIHIYNAEAFYEVKNKENKTLETSLYISILFLGSLIIMVLFSFLIYLQNKSSDFLSYSGYLIFVLAFSIVADFPVKFSSFFVWNYPTIFINSKETLVFAYLICYHLFLIKFLTLKIRLKSVYTGLLIINYIFTGIIIINIILLISSNLHLQNIGFKVNTVVLFAVIPYYGFLIYKLFKARHYNFYKYILWGILFFYIGNIGGTFSQIYGWDFGGLFPNNYTQIGTFIEVCFFSLGLGGKMIEESKEKIKYQNQVLEVQMMALQAQMNPHFTFNCLNAIRNLILQKQNDKASNYLLKFSKLLRLTLENSMQKQVSLTDNINYLEMYLAMENLRFNETLDYLIIKNLKQHSESIFIPPMLIQPFVENALKHAFNNQSTNKKIELTFTENENSLTVKVEDNGLGINQHLNLIPSEYKSRATEITKSYLLKWNSLLVQTITLNIEDKTVLNANQTGTLVTIKLAIN